MHREGGCNSYILGALELWRGSCLSMGITLQLLSTESLGCKMLSNLW